MSIAGQFTAFLALLDLAAGWSSALHAQSREQLIDRFRQQCLAKFAHLRGPGQRDVVRAHVRPCIQANMRAHVGAELSATQKRIEGFIDAGKLKEAEASAKAGIAKAKQLMQENRPPWAGGYALLGRALLFQGRLQEAEQAARQAVAIHKGLGKPDAAATASTLLAVILTQQGRHGEAETIFTDALAVLERDAGVADPQTARALLNFADLRFQQGRIADADRLARRALAVHLPKDARSAWTARALLAVGRASTAAGRFAEAEDYLKRALAAGEAAFGAQNWELSQILRFLGQLYFDTGRAAEAEPILRRSVEGFENTVGLQHRGSINAMRVLGSIKIALGDPAGAEAILRRALSFAEKVGGPDSKDHVSLTFLYRALGQAAHLQGRTAEAEQLFQDSLKAAEHVGKEGPYVGRALVGLGRHHLAMQRIDEARTSFQKALALAEKGSPEGLPVALTLRWLAELEIQNQQPAEALATLKRLTSVLDARRESARLLVGDRFNDEIAPLLRWVSLAYARAAWQLEKGAGPAASDAFVGAQYESQSTAAAAISQMAGRVSATDDALGQLMRAGQDLTQRWQAIDEQLTATLQEGPSAADARRALRSELDEIGKDLAKVGARLAAEFPQYAALAKPKPLSLAEVHKLLGPEEAVLVYLVGDRGSFVWAITQDRFTWQQVPLESKALGEKVVRLRTGLDVVELQKDARSGKPQLFDLKLAHELYSELVGPVAHALEGKRTLFVVPSGPLTSLPFHLLVTEPPANPITELDRIAEYSRAAWIINRHAITILPSVPSLKALREVGRRPAAGKPLIGFGDPTFDPGKPVQSSPRPRRPAAHPGRAYTAFWKGGAIDLQALAKGLEPLPETADELRGVARALAAPSDVIHLAAAASETTVKQADLSQYRVVYFATHGLIAGEISGLAEPALALAVPAAATDLDNGLLTASEVAQLKLNADWVVLSACNTAAGGRAGAEAFSGLARAFFYAGASTLLVSHWSVDSAAAVRLATKTFEALRQNQSIGRAEAVRQSMLAYMNDQSDPLNAYPAFWGPFALVGDGG